MNSDVHESAYELHRQGKYAEAVALYNSILQKDPNDAAALSHLGDILKRMGQLQAAEKIVRKAISAQPEYSQAHINLATIYKAQNRIDLAIEHYQTALKIGPEFAEIHNNLGNIYRSRGQRQLAIEHFRRGLAIDPGKAVLYRHLTEIEPRALSNKQIELLQKQFNTAIEADRIQLGFALGNALQDAEKYPQAFNYYRDANALMRKRYADFRRDWQNYVDTMIESLSAETMSSFMESRCTDKGALFIVGLPRSGKTTVESLIAEHPSVHAAGEIEELENILKQTVDVAKHPDKFADAARGNLQKIGTLYLQAVREKAPDADWIANTMPGNFMYLGIILTLLPNAKIIHCVRDPLENCLAIYQKYFANLKHWYAYDLEDLAEYFRGYQRLMSHWYETFGEAICTIQFESMTSKPLEVRNRISEFLGLKPIQTDETEAQIRNQLFPRNISDNGEPLRMAENYIDELSDLQAALKKIAD